MRIVAQTRVGPGMKVFPIVHPKRFWESKFSRWGGPRGFVAESVVIGFGADHSSWSTDWKHGFGMMSVQIL